MNHATVVPPEILHLVRFMCCTWSKIDSFVYEHAGEAIQNYPTIQGTTNQLNIEKIGLQEYDPEKVICAVRWMLENPE